MQMRTYENDYKASFDLTDFGSAETFRALLDAYGFERVETDEGFEWCSDEMGVALHTYCDPISGEHARSGQFNKEDEPGYASYIHLRGSYEGVHTIFDEIVSTAEYVKESSLGEFKH